MVATGIGLGGLEGGWWRLAQQPCVLPAYVENELTAIAHALFLFFDVVAAQYRAKSDAPDDLVHLLQYKAPAALRHTVHGGAPAQLVYGLRPDFQLHISNGRLQPVATELEIAPSAHGFAHAMQVAYDLPADLVPQYAEFLNGRPLLFVGTEQWSEFVLEQLAFCRALHEVGARGFVLYDRPIRTLAAEAAAGQRWQPPMFGIPRKTDDWNADVWGRIQRHGLESFIYPHDETWPADLGNAVVFRFGYGVNFSAEHLAHFERWRERGATLLNPPTFYLDSKSLLCALQLPHVRAQIAAASSTALAALDRAIPETHLLGLEGAPSLLSKLKQERTQWIIKFAGFDTGNQAWGGRSVQIGAQHTDAEWAALLEQAMRLPWPVAAQRMTPSLQIDMPYFDGAGAPAMLENGVTRLRTFMLRHAAGRVTVGGNHLTVSARQQVSEAVDAVQAPVLFGHSNLFDDNWL
ncbi:MAG: hypothetical protein R3A44_44045 [Caldilineaceae bacterium]